METQRSAALALCCLSVCLCVSVFLCVFRLLVSLNTGPGVAALNVCLTAFHDDLNVLAVVVVVVVATVKRALAILKVPLELVSRIVIDYSRLRG